MRIPRIRKPNMTNSTKNLWSMFKHGSGLGWKKKALVGGLLVASASAVVLAKVTPKIARKITRGVKKATKGQGTGRRGVLPKQKKGSMQDDVEIAPEEYTKGKNKVGLGTHRKMRKADNKGDDAFSRTRNSTTLTEEELRKEKETLDTENLRLRNQVIALCDSYNKSTGTLKVKHELDPTGTSLWLRLEGKVIKVSQRGLHSTVNNPYYIRKEMSMSDGLTRLVADFDIVFLEFFTHLILVYDMTLFEVVEKDVMKEQKEKENELTWDDLEGTNVIPMKSKEEEDEKPQEINSLGFEVS